MATLQAPPLPEELLSSLHTLLIRDLLGHGAVRDAGALAEALHAPESQVQDAFLALERTHGLVLHPGTTLPWVVHPFSLTPTAVWVQGVERGWWAPCLWCAFGIACLAADEVTIHSRWQGEAEPFSWRVQSGVPLPSCVVHFSIPLARAWDNVHAHCALVQAFKRDEDVDAWCLRHQVPRGETVPIATVQRLGAMWYGGYAADGWKKCSPSEAMEVFASAGLTSDFWRVSDHRESF